MKKFYKPFLKAYFLILNSIAFWPTVIALAFFLFSLLILRFENTTASQQLQQKITILLVHGLDNARLVLNAVITGIISLMVFSFSMVMIILSQASNSQSPRVIPGLASEKAYQIVLGFNIGTIVYALMMVLNLEDSNTLRNPVPEIGVLLAMLFAIVCLGLFVFFIHSVSRSIQVDNIMVRIYHNAVRHLQQEAKEYAGLGADYEEPDTSDWTVLLSREEGYLSLTEKDNMVNFACRHDLMIEILIKPGSFLVADYPLLKVSRDIRQNQELLEELYTYFIFSLSELNIRHYQYSLHQLSEIAVKALSPGINDPGTAITAVDFMTMIYLRKMACQTDRYLTDREGQVRVIRNVYSLDRLLYKYLTPIRHYGKADVMVTLKLLQCFRNLMYHDRHEKKHHPVFIGHIKSIQAEASENIHVVRDQEEVEKVIHDLLSGELTNYPGAGNRQGSGGPTYRNI